MYALIVFLGFFSCFVGIALYCTQRNVVLVRNGQPANAGTTLFPEIPLIPLLYVLVAWGIDHVSLGL